MEEQNVVIIIFVLLCLQVHYPGIKLHRLKSTAFKNHYCLKLFTLLQYTGIYTLRQVEEWFSLN